MQQKKEFWDWMRARTKPEEYEQLEKYNIIISENDVRN